MNAVSEALLAMYRQQVARSEHYETMRSTLLNYLFVMSGLLVSFAVYDDVIAGTDTLIGATLAILGLYGLAASVAHGRRSARHGKRAAAYRNALDAALPEAQINTIRQSVSRTSTRINLVWNLFPVFVSFLGLVIALIAASADS